MVLRFFLVGLALVALSLRADENPKLARGQFSLKSFAGVTACVALLSATVGTYYVAYQREAAYVAPVNVEKFTAVQAQALIERNLAAMVSLHGHFVPREEAVTIASVLDAEMGDSISKAYPEVQRFGLRIAELGYRLTPSELPHQYVLEVPEQAVSRDLFVEALTFIWLADSVRWPRKVSSMQDFFLNVRPLQGNPADRVQVVRGSGQTGSR